MEKFRLKILAISTLWSRSSQNPISCCLSRKSPPKISSIFVDNFLSYSTDTVRQAKKTDEGNKRNISGRCN